MAFVFITSKSLLAIPSHPPERRTKKAISDFNLKLFRHLPSPKKISSAAIREEPGERSEGKCNNVIHTKYAICNKNS
jgi:hypothetical protein